LPETAWARRTLSPEVWHRWAWCMSRSTVAGAMVLGIIGRCGKQDAHELHLRGEAGELHQCRG
jgi:hypothetical protein